MQIELDAATVAKLTKQAQAQALQSMVEQIMGRFDAKQIVGEVKNAAIRVASQQIADEIAKGYKTSAVVERALQSAEEKVRAQIATQLSKGINVKFAE